MRVMAAAAALLALAIAGCGGSVPRAPAAHRPPASAVSAGSTGTAEGAAFCARLRAAADPRPVYLDAVIRQDGQIASFSTAAPAAIERAARAQVAGWIAVYCPRFTYLTGNG